MIEWIKVRSPKISKIAYNSKVNTMFVSYKGNDVDTPYTGVSEDMFLKFSEASDIDKYFETHIKKTCKEVVLDTKNILNCDL